MYFLCILCASVVNFLYPVAQDLQPRKLQHDLLYPKLRKKYRCDLISAGAFNSNNFTRIKFFVHNLHAHLASGHRRGALAGGADRCPARGDIDKRVLSQAPVQKRGLHDPQCLACIRHAHWRLRDRFVGASVVPVGDAVCAAFIKRYGIDYTVLVPGEPRELADKMPQGVNLNSFPTSFILGRDGRVRSVHAGFPGPASGEFHQQAKAEITATVERLLSESNQSAAR